MTAKSILPAGILNSLWEQAHMTQIDPFSAKLSLRCSLLQAFLFPDFWNSRQDEIAAFFALLECQNSEVKRALLNSLLAMDETTATLVFPRLWPILKNSVFAAMAQSVAQKAPVDTMASLLHLTMKLLPFLPPTDLAGILEKTPALLPLSSPREQLAVLDIFIATPAEMRFPAGGRQLAACFPFCLSRGNRVCEAAVRAITTWLPSLDAKTAGEVCAIASSQSMLEETAGMVFPLLLEAGKRGVADDAAWSAMAQQVRKGGKWAGKFVQTLRGWEKMIGRKREVAAAIREVMKRQDGEMSFLDVVAANEVCGVVEREA